MNFRKQITPAALYSIAGFSATLVTFGPARVGFGLFLGDFRKSFGLNNADSGIVAGLGFSGFLLGLLAAGGLTRRRGERLPIMLGLALTTLGLALVAISRTVPVLALGVFLANCGPGLSWSPFNGVVHRAVREFRRARTLSIISTGTALGLVAAGLAALIVAGSGIGWRWAWAGFALLGALALGINGFSLRGSTGGASDERAERWSDTLKPLAAPLYLIAFSFGVTTSIFITFAAQLVEQRGGLAGVPANGSAAAIFIAFGMAGLAGIRTAAIVRRIGLPRLFALMMLASALSAALVGFAPASWAAILAASALQGIFVMVTSAAMALWSERIFSGATSLGFTAALVCVALGSVTGPVMAGFIYEGLGGRAALLAAGAISAISVLIARPRWIRTG